MEDNYKITDLLERLRNDNSWEADAEIRNMVVNAFSNQLGALI